VNLFEGTKIYDFIIFDIFPVVSCCFGETLLFGDFRGQLTTAKSFYKKKFERKVSLGRSLGQSELNCHTGMPNAT